MYTYNPEFLQAVSQMEADAARRHEAQEKNQRHLLERFRASDALEDYQMSFRFRLPEGRSNGFRTGGL